MMGEPPMPHLTYKFMSVAKFIIMNVKTALDYFSLSIGTTNKELMFCENFLYRIYGVSLVSMVRNLLIAL